MPQPTPPRPLAWPTPRVRVADAIARAIAAAQPGRPW